MNESPSIRRVVVATGTRAEFGLLETVMRAIDRHPELELLTVVAGAHLLEPAETWREVARSYDIAEQIPMQRTAAPTRLEDAAALGRGIEGFANAYARLEPHWVVVLGDRIEAFAAAAAASIGGIAVAHLHGGDRAEGVADEAMRHAITKLAHVHCPATEQSAARIERMGEPRDRIHVVGSPAIDVLSQIEPLDDEAWRQLGEPQFVVLFHPVGRSAQDEASDAAAILNGLAGSRILALHPNHDPGRDGVLSALTDAESKQDAIAVLPHLERRRFVGLLRRLRSSGGVLIGNSSAALIEAAALGVPAVDIGPRQGGRERAGNVVHVDSPAHAELKAAISQAQSIGDSSISHPYGDGRTGERVAALLASIDPVQPGYLRKRSVY